MSGLQQFSDGRRPGKAPGRSSFMHTCNLLSRYIKKKGSLRDFNLEIDGKIEILESIMKSGSAHAASASSTVNLLTQMHKPARPSTDSFPRPARPDSFVNLLVDASKKDIKSKDATKIESKTAQLTIFYAGRVLVFDGCPADKAKELVKFASKDSPPISGGFVYNILHQNPSPSAVAATTPSSRDGLPPVPSFQTAGCISSNVVGQQKAGGISSNSSKDIANNRSGEEVLSSGTEAHISPQPEVNGSDLPIARRSSVRRFLEKTKERYKYRAYQSTSQRDQLLLNKVLSSKTEVLQEGHTKFKNMHPLLLLPPKEMNTWTSNYSLCLAFKNGSLFIYCYLVMKMNPHLIRTTNCFIF